MDKLTKEQRKKNMQAVKNKDPWDKLATLEKTTNVAQCPKKSLKQRQ